MTSRTLTGLVFSTLPLGAVEPLAFNRDIRPILSRTCFTCHGPDAAAVKGELRLDSRELALKGGESEKPAIVPGDPQASPVVQHINSKDPEMVMPPPDSHLKFTSEDAEKITRWIKEGAKYEGHWAFQAPVKAPVPDVADAPPNPIDHFVAAKLKAENLSFSPEADKSTLIRRACFDLTGLPPTPEEIRTFAEDTTPVAYEKMIDRLLASPRFGENFAVSWLDASRYADTNGYSIDGGRDQWIWRDWVINSFNSNQPYDQFLTDQIAGDLLPDATEQQIVATGFSRNHAITHEGGTIPEENLVNYVADRVKTTSETFLGLTLGCAQCHDHKYDPVTQRDYYRFYAFFNTVGDQGLDGNAGVNAAPAINAASCLASPGEAETVRAELDAARRDFAAPIPEAFEKWQSRPARRSRRMRTRPRPHPAGSRQRHLAERQPGPHQDPARPLRHHRRRRLLRLQRPRQAPSRRPDHPRTSHRLFTVRCIERQARIRQGEGSRRKFHAQHRDHLGLHLPGGKCRSQCRPARSPD